MFNDIAPSYDFLNHFFSLGIDILWRKKAISLLKTYKPKNILDVATGTADLAIEAVSLDPDQVYGIDVSERMMDLGRMKIASRNLSGKIELSHGNAEKIPFPDNTFDAVTVGFGVRNFGNIPLGLKEMKRVLKANGSLVVLDFSKPVSFPVKQLYGIYFSIIVPLIGRFISRHKSAYSYLPESVSSFPDGQAFVKLLIEAGFSDTKWIPLTFGIASIYSGKKS